MPRFLFWPRPMNLVLIAIGALLLGARAAANVAPTPNARTVVQPGETRTRVSVRTVARKVRGRIVRVHDKVYVTVPQVIVHVDSRTIRVPAHRLPIRSGSAVVANPLVTVYIPVPTTVFVPTTVTETAPASTVTITIPTTVTIPLIPTTSDH